MEKKIVCIDVGSEVIDILNNRRIVLFIDLKWEEIEFSDDWIFSFSYFENTWRKDCISINGILIDEIEEIRIKGYNDKITLKVGDELISCRYKNKNSCTYKKFNQFIISRIHNGKVYAKSCENKEEEYFLCNEANKYWYVNGKRYCRDDIIIPNKSVQVNEMVNPFIKKSMDTAKAASDLEPVKTGNQVVEQHEEFEEITKDNFQDVLLYNKYNIFSKGSDGTATYRLGNSYIYINDSLKYVGSIPGVFKITTYSWEDVVNIFVPKFGLKPIPKFDFTRFLTDNGGVISYHQNSSSKTIEFNVNKILIQVFIDEIGECNFMGRTIEKSKQNADSVLNVVKLWKDLK